MRILLRSVVLAAGFATSGWSAEPDQPPSPASTAVTVLLSDERRFTAHVDQRTDDEMLWLRFVRGTAALSSGFTWDLVQSVRVGQDHYTAAEFRDIAPHFASGLPASFTKQGLGLATVPPTPRLGSSDHRVGVGANKVQWLSVDAALANWDRDADLDGIELRIAPRTADERVLAVDGALTVDLIGRHYFPADDEPGFSKLGQWSQRVRTANFVGPSGAVYRLPFTSIQPDFDPTLQSIGLLHVQLNVFGHGDFAAKSTVRIRSHDPIRDGLLEHGIHHDSFGRYRARHW